MDRRVGYMLAAGCVVAAGAIAIVAAAMTLNGFQDSAGGDVVVSSAMGKGLSLALVLFATLPVLVLCLRRLPSCRVTSDAAPPAFAARERSQSGSSSRAWRPRCGPR